MKRGYETVPVGESSICKRYGIQKTPASGAFWTHKGDGTKGEERYEIKETDKKSLSIKAEWLNKIRSEAAERGDLPRFLFRIGNEIWAAMPAGEYFWNNDKED